MDKLNIINSALNLLNGTELDDLVTETDDQKIALRYYDMALASVLTMEKWLCAVKYLDLVEDITGLVPITEFTKVFVIPANVTKVITFYIGGEIGTHRVDYIRSGNLIYTSATTVVIECVELIESDAMTPILTEVFILKLASLMASILTDVSSGLRVEYVNQIEMLIPIGINEIDYSINNDYSTRMLTIAGME